MLRQDVHARRIATTLRELAPAFLPPHGAHGALGAALLATAASYAGRPVAPASASEG